MFKLLTLECYKTFNNVLEHRMNINVYISTFELSDMHNIHTYTCNTHL